MNKLIVRSIVLLVATFFALSSYAQTDTLSVIFVTDTHSHLLPFGAKDANGKGSLGGIARAATVIKTLMQTEKHPLLVHSGDLFVADFMFNKFFGVPEFKILKDLGLRAMCVGNHEFDLTPARLKATILEAGLPESNLRLITANVDMSLDPELANLVKPYTIVEFGDLKVGLFGLTPSMTNTFSNPAPNVITDYIAAARNAVDSLKTKCDVVIGLTHLNVSDDDSLAAKVPGIDVIIGGHAHVANQEPKMVGNAEGATPIIRAGCYYKYVGLARLAVSPSGTQLVHHELIPIDSSVPEDTQVALRVDSLVAEVEADPKFGPVFTQIIGQVTNELSHNSGVGFRDAPLGNLVTDAMRRATGTDLALDVEGWMGQPLPAGPVTANDVLQSTPYGYDAESGGGFKLVTFKLSAFYLKMAVEFALDEARTNSDFNLQISNGQIIYDSRQPKGQKIKTMTVAGQPLSLFGEYSITVSDGLAKYLALAGLSMVVPEPTGLVEYKVVCDFIRQNSPIAYGVEGRVQDIAQTSVRQEESGVIPERAALLQNYPNPFNPTTFISFGVPANAGKSQHVRLQVYDVNGRKVATLVDAHRQTGFYTEAWKGTDDRNQPVASGVYFYRLEVGDLAVVAKRMTLVR